MPIKPENRHRYPKDWKAIRAAILERAGHRCHLAHDAEHHQQTAYETRRRPLALRDLFDHA
ncbi:MAG: hypothetical protein EKK68_14035 [Candidatus Competibacteraceae bacterium]|nr:MAG: hypothetical protein EKK68_14035 [Candidatus Competibacteraceae bacterium]